MMRSRSDESRGAVSEVPAESSIGLVFLSGSGNSKPSRSKEGVDSGAETA